MKSILWVVVGLFGFVGWSQGARLDCKIYDAKNREPKEENVLVDVKNLDTGKTRDGRPKGFVIYRPDEKNQLTILLVEQRDGSHRMNLTALIDEKPMKFETTFVETEFDFSVGVPKPGEVGERVRQGYRMICE